MLASGYETALTPLLGARFLLPSVNYAATPMLLQNWLFRSQVLKPGHSTTLRYSLASSRADVAITRLPSTEMLQSLLTVELGIGDWRKFCR